MKIYPDDHGHLPRTKVSKKIFSKRYGIPRCVKFREAHFSTCKNTREDGPEKCIPPPPTTRDAHQIQTQNKQTGSFQTCPPKSELCTTILKTTVPAPELAEEDLDSPLKR